jgi:hypothetical protein
VVSISSILSKYSSFVTHYLGNPGTNQVSSQSDFLGLSLIFKRVIQNKSNTLATPTRSENQSAKLAVRLTMGCVNSSTALTAKIVTKRMKPGSKETDA